NKYQIPRLDRDIKLARQVHAEGVPNRPLDNQLASEVKKYWCVQRFVPLEPDEQPSFIAFWDALENRHRVGFYSRHDDDGLSLLSAGTPVMERGGKPWIDSGLARPAPLDKMKLEPDADFIDLCVLSVAQKLGSPANSPRLINLAVKVKVDWLEE